VVGPTVESASVIVVVPAVAGAWALAGPGVVVGLLTGSGTVSGVGSRGLGAVVGSRGSVVGVDADLVAGSAWTAGSTRAGARHGGGGWGDRVAEATRAARTAVVSPKATSPSHQGHRDIARGRGPGDISCRGRDVDMVHCPGWTSFQGLPGPLHMSVAWSYPVTPLAAFALSGAFDK
jgi:hypothetical protein